MASKWFHLVGFVAAISIRLTFSLSGASKVLQHRVEVVTPTNSLKRLAEARWLIDNGMSPYEGWAYHASPCYVYLLQPVIGAIQRQDARLSKISGTLLCIAADLLAAVLLQAIVFRACKPGNFESASGQDVPSCSAVEAHGAKQLDLTSPEERKSAYVHDGASGDAPFNDLAGILYLLNPYTIAACIGGSTGSIDNCAVLLALYGSVNGSIPLATFGLVLASHLTLHPALLIVPCFLLLHQGLDRRKPCQPPPASDTIDIAPRNQNEPPTKKRPAMVDISTYRESRTGSGVILLAAFFSIGLGFWTVALLALCKVLLGERGSLLQMWKATHGFILAADDLTPNIGLFWYFFAEVFDHFRTFFLFVFHYLVLVIMLPPLTIRFHHRPLFLAYVILGLTSIFKSYPSVSDAALYLGLLPAFARELRQMRFVFVGVNGLLVASVIGPVMYNLWIWKNVGNANFFYAMTLVYACAQAVLLIQSTAAVLQYDKSRNSPQDLST
ncbi:phosphatidylinositol glycan class U [Klebsormidium nitens]|uniref:Phosphatidylinositol glycan class U n=1 Tax=Klebsormidium nitens TaxID=105231 RepID=A0A1Y1I341_KLENI|nr:phosphatidylinositol glycan class U [Klebsormidium nitens]|eukprot:GAQ83601.1 phosphatidylinositol glycan class U [Klebsormidium nitens]